MPDDYGMCRCHRRYRIDDCPATGPDGLCDGCRANCTEPESTNA